MVITISDGASFLRDLYSISAKNGKMAPSVTDIEELVIGWAWTIFSKTRSKDDKKLKFEDVRFEVNWDRVKFKAGKPDFSDKQKPDTPGTQVVFKSVYDNKTDSFQDHTFTAERCTVSSATTEVTKGYTKGMHLDLSLGLPYDVATATAGFGREVHMESSDECTHEESVKWAINSTIKVPPKHRTVAELVVKEQQYTASFRMETRIQGRVIVIIKNPREQNAFLQSVEGDFCDIMAEAGKDSKFNITGKVVTWEVSGKCDFDLE